MRQELKFAITKSWDGDTPPDCEEINIILNEKLSSTSKIPEGLVIHIDAPFYNDPAVPSSIARGSTPQLWDFEVVELFFLGKNDHYLEVELGPNGHYLLLELHGSRNITKESLPLTYYETEIINGNRWTGEAIIPWKYFPTTVNKFNAYAIHKSDPTRVYMALYPVPKGKFDCPNFHRLDYFKHIDFKFGVK